MTLLNPTSNVNNSAFTMLDGPMNEFYNEVDEAITGGDAVKATYRIVSMPAYNAPNPVDSASFTTVALNESGPMVVCLENSYICCDICLDLELTVPIVQDSHSENGAASGHRVGLDQVWFIGWKSSMEAIQRYDILVNSTPFYSQAFCGEESFIQYQTYPDSKLNSEPFVLTSYENASTMSPCLCGTYILIKGQTANLKDNNNPAAADYLKRTQIDKIKVKIPIKIPLTSFLILRDMKYLMSWMGKWELRLYFSPQNLVVLPVKPQVVDRWWDSILYKYNKTPITDWQDFAPAQNFYNDGVASSGKGVPKAQAEIRQKYPEMKGWFKWDLAKRIPGHRPESKWQASESFIQFGDPIWACTYIGSGPPNHYANYDPNHPNTTTHWGETCLKLSKMTMHDVQTIHMQFMIRTDVLEMLKSKYLSDKPLTFPVSTIQVSRFTGIPLWGQEVKKGQSKPFTMVLNQAMNNVNTIVILPFGSFYQHTVCYQPWIKNFQLFAGEFGTYPIQPIDTFETYDNRLHIMRYLNYIYDSLNANGSPFYNISKRFANQYQNRIFLTRC
ncbi:MAG: hypothetical protein LBR15_02890, partial [Methanobrevibacter sp.]|nr:hypothetical protein [Candidatus Methanovirga australis]